MFYASSKLLGDLRALFGVNELLRLLFSRGRGDETKPEQNY